MRDVSTTTRSNVFCNKFRHGEGVLVYRDGKSVRGKWERNRLVEVLDEVVGG